MAFRRYLRLLIGCTRPILPLSYHLLTAKETILIAPLKRQLHCSQLPSFHVVSWPTRFVVRVRPCRHYVIGTSTDDDDSNAKYDKDDTWSDTSVSNPKTDSSDLAYPDEQRSAVVNTSVLDHTSVTDVRVIVTEGEVKSSGQEDYTGAIEETKSASKDSWSSQDDDLVIYTDQDFLRMRQEKKQTQEGRRRDDVIDDYKQDEQDLQVLLRNIQHQQEEQSKRTQREKRSSMMDVEELVEFLREENAKDLCVIQVPTEVDYVDYFIVCSGMGSRHIGRMADHLVSEMKYVRVGRSQRRVRVEGRNCHDWMAVDLGTMVVHFMLEEMREKIELEKLWTLGEQYDDQCRTMAKYYQESLILDST